MKDSNNYKKLENKINKLYDKCNIVRDNSCIINENKVIVVEDLNVIEMFQNKRIAKILGDISISNLLIC